MLHATYLLKALYAYNKEDTQNGATIVKNGNLVLFVTMPTSKST